MTGLATTNVGLHLLLASGPTVVPFLPVPVIDREEGEEAKINDWLREIVPLALGEKGDYAFDPQPTHPIASIDEIEKMSSKQVSAIGGKIAGLILEIEALGTKGGFNVGIAANRGWAL